MAERRDMKESQQSERRSEDERRIGSGSEYERPNQTRADLEE